MKKKLTTILAMLLCAIITITGVCTETAYAAEDTTIKLTFKKKSVTYSVKENGIERVNLKSLKKSGASLLIRMNITVSTATHGQKARPTSPMKIIQLRQNDLSS